LAIDVPVMPNAARVITPVVFWVAAEVCVSVAVAASGSARNSLNSICPTAASPVTNPSIRNH
jgi:hypothetical protein